MEKLNRQTDREIKSTKKDRLGRDKVSIKMKQIPINIRNLILKKRATDKCLR
jgi:hypothetical protein